MAKTCYVVGGEYADTSFSQIASGHREERFGPFGEREAHECWRALTGKSVDNAMVRYFIRSEEDAAADQWYVVGGEYADTGFQQIAKGRTIETHGPFSRKEAMDTWRALTGKTVDSAMTRYDLCTAGELAQRQQR
jgi:acyl-CoA-binding protein